MPKLLMTVGLPGSGKTTVARDLEDRMGFLRLSSDDIRDELDGADNGAVFGELHRRMLAALADGRDVLYDATNLSRKRRMHALRLAGSGVYKICYAFDAPMGVCLARNDLRSGKERVPEEVIWGMLKSYKMPVVGEGFDHIYHVSDEDYECAERSVRWDDMVGFDQDNHHHALTLDEHSESCERISRELCAERGVAPDDGRIVALAARYHDIGKLVTKTYVNTHGQPTDEAHYYGHDSAGAYLMLCEIWPSLANAEMRDFSWVDAMDVILLIEQHMRPYLVEKGSKADLRDREFFGERFCALRDIIHEADRLAH